MALVIILGFLGTVASIRSLALTLARPFWDLGQATSRGLSIDSGLIESKQSLIIENGNLRQEIQKLNGRLLEFNRLVAENLDLKNLLGRKEIGYSEILVQIMSGPNQTPFDTILIDRGEAAGVKLGDRVIAVGSVPIALVTEVFKNSARATLFSFPGRSADVLIGDSGIITTAIGRGGGNFEAKLPREIEIEAGDPIVIPEIDPHIFAVVEDVVSKPTDSFQTIYFKNPVNISELEWVVVSQNK